MLLSHCWSAVSTCYLSCCSIHTYSFSVDHLVYVGPREDGGLATLSGEYPIGSVVNQVYKH